MISYRGFPDLDFGGATCVAKEGIGFDPSQKKKKLQDTPPQQQVIFVQEGHKEKEKGNEKVGEGVITKEMVPSPNFVGMNNPSYFLLTRDDSYTCAKFVGTNYDDYAWTIWVPKVLIPNPLGPIEKWGPQNKAWSLQDYTSGGTQWVIDSGCTNHMTGGKDMLVDLVDLLKSSLDISFGDNSKGKVLWLGKFVISSDASLKNGMLVQSLHYNLLSTIQLARAGYD